MRGWSLEMKIMLALSFLSGLILVFSSRNKKRYQRLSRKYGEEFADKNTKTLKRCGYGLLILSAFYLLIILF